MLSFPTSAARCWLAGALKMERAAWIMNNVGVNDMLRIRSMSGEHILAVVCCILCLQSKVACGML